MADLQKQFEQFNAAIRVDFDMSQELRDKRDIVVEKIKKHLKENKKPDCRVLLQGSYKMKTGVKPIADLEYDIDIGLRFDIKPEEHDPKDVRQWVYDAVKDHTDRCEDRGPCVRVVYEKGFHLDLVTYATWEVETAEQYRLAHKSRGWLEADPPTLLEFVANARQPFEETIDSLTQTDQFRRVVRCLRRWADVQVPKETDQKLTGLAFVLLCAQKLVVTRFPDLRSDDRRAAEMLARQAAQTVGRIVLKKPTPEFEDVVAGITDAEMKEWKIRFGALADALQEAGRLTDPVEACKLLVKHFGDDFPVPAPEDTGKRTKAPAITTSSVSA
jgi:Second Messenger Oligonucleotide or Dinucleotide Synthetase domain